MDADKLEKINILVTSAMVTALLIKIIYRLSKTRIFDGELYRLKAGGLNIPILVRMVEKRILPKLKAKNIRYRVIKRGKVVAIYVNAVDAKKHRQEVWNNIFHSKITVIHKG